MHGPFIERARWLTWIQSYATGNGGKLSQIQVTVNVHGLNLVVLMLNRR
jgi:hypothetical protein